MAKIAYFIHEHKSITFIFNAKFKGTFTTVSFLYMAIKDLYLDPKNKNPIEKFILNEFHEPSPF